MATLEERVATLEQAMSDAQHQILLRATTAAVSTLEAARDGAQDQNNLDFSSLETRVNKLEQFVSTLLKTSLSAYKKNSDDELGEDLILTNSTVGVILKSSDNKKYRLGVTSGGSLTLTLVP